MSHGFDSSSRPTRRALAAAASLLVAAALVMVPGSVASGSTSAPAGVSDDSTDGHREGALPRLKGSVGPGFDISISPNSVPAGRYKLIVKDESTIHNFHISGTGVDKKTGVPFVGRKVFKITFTAGTYDIVCDRHSSMNTTLTVT